MRLKILGLGGVIHVLGQSSSFSFVLIFSSTTEKMSLEHFFNGQSRAEFQNRENEEIPGNNMKSGIFDIQMTKQNHFQGIKLKFCTHTYSLRSALSYIFLFEN